MSEEIKGEFRYQIKSNGGFQIKVIDAAFYIKDNLLVFEKIPKNHGEEILRQKSILRGDSALGNLQIHLGEQALEEIILEKCEVTFKEGNTTTGIYSITFNQCRINGVFSFKQLNIRVENPEEGLLKIYSDLKLYIEGLKCIVGSVTVECDSTQKVLIYVTPGNNNFQIEGRCMSLSSDSRSVAINFTNNFFARKLMLTSSIFIENFFASQNSFIHREQDALLLRAFRKVSKIYFRKITIKLTVENVDFSRTALYFEDNAALDFDNDKFRSIASVWNPDTISYRGFTTSKKWGADDLKKINPLPAQEFFCEMKSYFSRRGDSVSASQFYSAEMQAHYAALRKRKGTSGDKFTLYLSSTTSNFGQSWVRPFVLYVLLAFLVYLFILWTNGSLSNLLNVFIKLELFVKILSPIELIKADFDDLINNSSRFQALRWLIWLLWKIAAAYLIYQIIIASRKYIRKF